MKTVRNSADAVQALRNLLVLNLQGNVMVVNRVSSLIRDAINRSAVSPLTVTSIPELAARLTEFNVNVLSLLSTHSLGFLNDVTTVAEESLGLRAKKAKSVPSSKEPAMLYAEVRRGESARVPFAVENSYPHAVDVQFTATPLVSSSGELPKDQAVEVIPPERRLDPQEQAVVELNIRTSREFKVGEVYTSRIETRGFTARAINLKVKIVESSENSSILAAAKKRRVAAPGKKPTSKPRKRRPQGTKE